MIFEHLKSLNELSEKKMKEERQIIRLELGIIQKMSVQSKKIDLPAIEKKIKITEQSILQDYNRYYVHVQQLRELLDPHPSPYKKILWARYVQYLPWSQILPHQKYPAPFIHPDFIRIFRDFR